MSVKMAANPGSNRFLGNRLRFGSFVFVQESGRLQVIGIFNENEDFVKPETIRCSSANVKDYRFFL